MASSTGEVTSERLSLTVLRARAGLEPGLGHRAGRDPQRGTLAEFGGPLADEAVDDLIGVGGFDADLDAPVSDRVGRARL